VLVVVNGALTYECPFPVSVGDRVLLPALPRTKSRENWVAVVTALGSDYPGPYKKVIEVMPRFLAPKNPTAAEHRGRLDQVLFSDDSQPHVIIKLDDGSTMHGPATSDDFDRGVIYAFHGGWENTPERGYRFRFSTFVPFARLSKTAVVKYLGELTDVFTPRVAGRIYDKLGPECLDRLREDPVSVAVDLGLPPEACSAASDDLRRDQRLASTRLALFGLFEKRGFPGKIIGDALRRWGERAPDVVRKNPFKLLPLSGAGFKRCDRLWTDLGLPRDAARRAVACTEHILLGDTAGHTWLKASAVGAKLRASAPGADDVLAFRVATRACRVRKRWDAAGELWLAGYARAAAEERVAGAVRRLMAGRAEWPTGEVPVSRADGDKLPRPHQIDRLLRATRRPIGILIGGPGTGKSHVTAFLMKAIIRRFGEGEVLACAPTGKAAVRMTQALSLAGIGLTARTIHSTLEIGRNGRDGDGWGFKRNARNPLDAKFVFADESSMDDTGLLADLLDAVPAGGHVLLVGDAHQLPPVGHGAPLRDLVRAGVPHGELTEVHRNAGQIVHACARIRNGESFDVCRSGGELDFDPAPGSPPRNLLLLEADGEEKQMETLVGLVGSMKRFDPVWQTQVLVARNTRGGVCRKVVNETLRPLLNPGGRASAENPFRVGDKIICTRNGHRPVVRLPAHLAGKGGTPGEVTEATEAAEAATSYEPVRDDVTGEAVSVYVANGEIGKVVAVAPRLAVARMSEADRLVKIPIGRQRGEDDGGDRDEDSDAGRGCQFDLAYAISTHKAQGSESPCVIIMGDEGAYNLATREWIYTAISRASKLCILVGKMQTFLRMKNKVSLVTRKTFLAEDVRAAILEGV
jgi:exodeoxyribonuclease V alpha subunit